MTVSCTSYSIVSIVLRKSPLEYRESVLASVDYNEDAALDILLGMSDPSYVSSQQHHPAPQPSSVELDEALARQLQLEDDRQAAGHSGHVPPRASGQSWPRRSADDRDVEVPYATRTVCSCLRNLAFHSILNLVFIDLGAASSKFGSRPGS
jgi:hypothetical protein